MVTVRNLKWKSAPFAIVMDGYEEIEINPAHVVRVDPIVVKHWTYSSKKPCYNVRTTVCSYEFFLADEKDAKADRDKLIAAVDAHNEGVTNVS